MKKAVIAGISGRRRRVPMVNTAVGRVRLGEVRRQGAVPVVLFGNIVKVIAYDKRR